jgi:hypothetical protein
VNVHIARHVFGVARGVARFKIGVDSRTAAGDPEQTYDGRVRSSLHGRKPDIAHVVIFSGGFAFKSIPTTSKA